MPTSGNTNLYFEAHKPVFFNKNLYFLKTYTNRCFAVAMCCVMSYLPLAAMLKSAHNVHLAWFSPFLDGFMKSQLREYSSLKVCFLSFLDAITLINCIKYPGKICFYFLSFPNEPPPLKFRSHAITTETPNAFRRRVLIGCYRLLNAETTNHA